MLYTTISDDGIQSCLKRANTAFPDDGIQSGIKTAFTAFLDHRESYSPGDVLIFNRIISSYNNGYDPSTGIFTARAPGIYMFSFQIEHWNTMEFPVHLVVDNATQVSAIISTKQLSTQSGNTAVLELKSEQSVWIEADRDGELFGSDRSRGTTFTGAFLY